MSSRVRPNRIKEWIAKSSLNQSAVARKLGISTSYLSLITNGKRNPNLRLSTKLANLLDADLLDLFPQQADSAVSANRLDLIFCYAPRPEFEKLSEVFQSKQLKMVCTSGDFEAGYQLALHRPYVFLFDVESMGRSLNSLVQGLKSEPTTAHTQVVPLIRTDIGKRRRRQIDKMGLEVCEWGARSIDEIADQIKEMVTQAQAKAREVTVSNKTE